MTRLTMHRTGGERQGHRVQRAASLMLYVVHAKTPRMLRYM